MKKRVLSVMMAMLMAALCFTGCGKEEGALQKVRLCEVTHSIFYAPQYAAISNGYFEEEGIDIELSTGEGADKVMSALLGGDCDVAFAGPEATVYVYQNDQEDYAVNFMALTKRDGSFLVGREPDSDFSFEKLKGKTVIGGRKGGMPEMSLEWVLKENGLTPGKDLTVDTSVQFAAMAGAFIGGEGDYVTLFEPVASNLEKEGKGYVVASIGVESGEVPYTVYCARRSFMEENPALITAFSRAVQKGLDFVQSAPSEEIALAIQPFFADTEMEDLIASIDRYRAQDSWSKDGIVSEEAFIHMQDIMMAAGELENYAPYDKLFDFSNK